MSERSFQRLESKKKKAAAFMRLVNSDEEYNLSKAKDATLNREQGMESAASSSSGYTASVSSKDNVNPQKNMSLSDQMFAEYKKMMREKKKESMQRPKVFLTLDELARDDPMQTSLDEVKVTPPLFMADIQSLLLYALQGIQASIKPRWCRLLRVGKISKVAVVVLDDVSREEFQKYPESLATLQQASDLHVDVVCPFVYGSSVREDLMNVPMSMTQLKKKDLLGNQNEKAKTAFQKPRPSVNKQLWTSAKIMNALVENPLTSIDDITVTMREKRKHEQEMHDDWNSKRMKVEEGLDSGSVVSTSECDQYDRRWLMLNSAQMILEGIPAPVIADKRSKGFLFSKERYKAVTERSPLYALDCEMVQTKASVMDLARVSIVDENLAVVYDSFVKPWAPVTNYVTQFSGITKEILDPVTTRIQDVQHIIRTYLPPDAILCGQSIGSDLSSMKLFHPYIIDTSVIYNLTGERRLKTGLKRLASIFLGRDIQSGNDGHSSVEDAQATMELVLTKLRHSMEFGDILMSTPEDVALKMELKTNNGCDVINVNNADNAKDEETNVKGYLSVKTDDTTTADELVKESRQVCCEDQKDSGEMSCNGVIKEPAECHCKSLTQTAQSDRQRSADIQRRRLFFQREGTKFMECFFQRIQKQKQSGALVDEDNSVPLYSDTVPVTICKNDKEAEKLTLERLKDAAVCFTYLYGYREFQKKSRNCDNVDEEKTKACLWKLDRRVWKILSGLPPCSLFVVILPGREVDTQDQPATTAMTFAKIT